MYLTLFLRELTKKFGYSNAFDNWCLKIMKQF